MLVGRPAAECFDACVRGCTWLPGPLFCAAADSAPLPRLASLLLQATAAGVKETEATNMLEKKFRSGPQYSRKEVIELAISVLQVRGLHARMVC